MHKGKKQWKTKSKIFDHDTMQEYFEKENKQEKLHL